MTIHLHLGAHKTASTHLQAVMRKNNGKLIAAGVHYADPSSLRDRLGPAQRAAEVLAPLPSLRAIIAALRMRRQVAAAPRLFIAADENTLGHCTDMMDAAALYPAARIRLSLWQRIAARRPITCFLAVRDYPEFFSGVHVQSIRDNLFTALGPDDTAALTALPRRWPDLVADIRAALPSARIVLWQYEDYKRLKGRIADRLTGIEGLRAVERRSMQTPSRTAMVALQSLAAAHRDGRVPRDAFARIVQDHPIGPGNPRYTPWTADQIAAMRAAYADDIARLRADPAVEFLRA